MHYTVAVNGSEWLDCRMPTSHWFVECLRSSARHFYHMFAVLPHLGWNRYDNADLKQSQWIILSFCWFGQKKMYGYGVRASKTNPIVLESNSAQYLRVWLYGNDQLSAQYRCDFRINRVTLVHRWTSSVWNGTVCHRRIVLHWSLPMVMVHRMHHLPTMPFQRLA